MLKEHACRYCDRTKRISDYLICTLIVFADFHMGGIGNVRTKKYMRDIVRFGDKDACKLVGVDAREVSITITLLDAY